MQGHKNKIGAENDTIKTRQPALFQPARLKMLQALTAVVWTIVFVAGVGRFKLAARAPLKVSLKTAPASVRLTLDNQRLFDGHYVVTPLVVDLTPGKHRLKIARAGYVAHVVSIDGDNGDVIKMEDVVLERNQAVSLALADVQVRGGDPEVYAEIDAGFLAGVTPLAPDDLTVGEAHTLTIYPKWPDRGDSQRCRFVLTSESATEPLLLEIAKRGDHRVVSNCKKLKNRGSATKHTDD